MEILCCNEPVQSFQFSDFIDIIIAILTFVLAFYVFVYQKKQDLKNTKLEWFKELIIQPKLETIYLFYDNIGSLKSKINSSDLTDEQKIKLIEFIKLEHSTLRKSFVDLLQFTTPELFQEIRNNLDNLIDSLTIAIDTSISPLSYF